MRKLAAFGCLWAVAAKVPLRPPAHGQRRRGPAARVARVGNAENHGTAKPLRPPVSLVDATVCAAIPCTRAHWGPLLRRSLDSVAKQTRRVDRVVVVLSLVGLKPDEFKKMCAARQTGSRHGTPTRPLCVRRPSAVTAHTQLTAMQPAARVTPLGSHSSTQTTKCNQSVWSACLATCCVTVPTLGCIHLSFAGRRLSDSIRRHCLSASIRRQVAGATFPRTACSPRLRRRLCCGHVRIAQLSQSKASAPWPN
jgi:hypothetical protein